MTTLKNYFLCIGAQKSGTTWLYQNLKKQNKIWFPPRKELHYFDSLYLDGYEERFRQRRLMAHKRLVDKIDIKNTSPENQEILAWSSKYTLTAELNDQWYASLFPKFDISIHIGEITPAYATLPKKGFEHIASLAPDVKIIFIMRDPVERSWSQIRFFADFYNDKQLLSESGAIAFSDTFECHSRSQYDRTIDNVESIFDKKNLMYLYYEDLFQESQTYLQKICKFIGFKFDERAQSSINKKIYSSPKVTIPKGLRTHLENKYSYLSPYLIQKIGDIPISWNK